MDNPFSDTNCTDDNEYADAVCKGSCADLAINCGQLLGCGSWTGDVASFCPQTCGKCSQEKSYNCMTKEVWSNDKKEWCCRVKKLGCPVAPYDPCERKKEGERCTVCDPKDRACMEAKVLKTCQKGQCMASFPGP